VWFRGTTLSHYQNKDPPLFGSPHRVSTVLLLSIHIILTHNAQLLGQSIPQTINRRSETPSLLALDILALHIFGEPKAFKGHFICSSCASNPIFSLPLSRVSSLDCSCLPETQVLNPCSNHLTKEAMEGKGGNWKWIRELQATLSEHTLLREERVLGEGGSSRACPSSQFPPLGEGCCQTRRKEVDQRWLLDLYQAHQLGRWWQKLFLRDGVRGWRRSRTTSREWTSE